MKSEQIITSQYLFNYLTMKTLVLTLLMIGLGCSRNIQQHFDQNSYLSEFANKHHQFRQNLNTLSQDISQSKADAQNEEDLDQKIKKLQSSIIRQKKILTDTSISHIPPINEIDWKCPDLQGTSLQELRSLADDVKTETNKLEDTIDSLKGKQTAESIQNAGSAVTYANAVRESLNPKIDFYDPNNANIGYISDLSGNNWTPGGLTTQEVQEKMQNDKGKYGIVKVCPQPTPFFNGKTCINCDSGSFFNIQSNTCFSCSDFSLDDKKCLSSSGDIDGTNVDVGLKRLILPAGVTASQIKQQVKNPCPSQNPFFANNYCVECEGTTPLFDYDKEECTNCPKDYIYSSEQFKCLKKAIYDTNYPFAKNRIIIPEGKRLQQLEQQQAKLGETENLIVCEVQKPFYNTESNECMDCEPQTYFKMETNKCQKCDAGLTYYQVAHRCVSSPIYSNLAHPNWTAINPDSVRQKIAKTKRMQYSQECPIETSFYNGNKCIKCPKNKVFSFDTNQCTQCSQGTFFSKNFHQCMKPDGAYQTNPEKAPNLIYGGVSKAEWSSRYYQNIQKNPNIADCPEQRPYFEGIVCMQCPDQSPYFNMFYKVCQACEQGSTYDEGVRECLTDSGQIINQTPNLQKMAAGIFT